MKILIVEPEKHPYEKDIENTIKNLQEIVGGYIQAVYPYDDKVALVCNEEGLFDNSIKWNRLIPELNQAIKGTFFICGVGTEDFTDLSPELLEKYKKRFWKIEVFFDGTAAIRKQIPARPIEIPISSGNYKILSCPGCKSPIINVWSKTAYRPKYCHFCGQALDWGGEK